MFLYNQQIKNVVLRVGDAMTDKKELVMQTKIS